MMCCWEEERYENREIIMSRRRHGIKFYLLKFEICGILVPTHIVWYRSIWYQLERRPHFWLWIVVTMSTICLFDEIYIPSYCPREPQSASAHTQLGRRYFSSKSKAQQEKKKEFHFYIGDNVFFSCYFRTSQYMWTHTATLDLEWKLNRHFPAWPLSRLIRRHKFLFFLYLVILYSNTSATCHVISLVKSNWTQLTLAPTQYVSRCRQLFFAFSYYWKV